MTLTLMVAAVAALGVIAYYVVAVRTAEPALIGDTTVVGLGDAAAETLRNSPEHRFTHRIADWQLTSVDDLTAAEDLLDALENQGYTERELVVMGNSSFAVRWR